MKFIVSCLLALAGSALATWPDTTKTTYTTTTICPVTTTVTEKGT